jgi:hypothetical protein
MLIKRLVSFCAALALIAAAASCVSTSRYNKDMAALNAWLKGGQPPSSESYFTSFYEWAQHISLVICDLENMDQAHKNVVQDPLCPAGPSDPKSDPPEPPDLPGDD